MLIHVAIDGPAGAGKSTIAKAVAQALCIPYLDTGAMYRTLAYYAIQHGINPQDAQGVARLLPGADIRAVYKGQAQHMLINGQDVTAFIRTPQISKGASDIGVHPAVRDKLVELQQRLAKDTSVVMDGRDIGTVVMPDAPHKFFVTASAAIRAQRRLLEMQQKGQTPLPSLQELEAQIQSRDATDSNRAYNPLRQAHDALLVDTSALSIEESVQSVLNAIQAKMNG